MTVDPLVLSETWERISADRAVKAGYENGQRTAYQLGMLEALIASMYCDLSSEQRAAFRERHNIVVEAV
jgi:ribosomal protein S9